MTVRRNICKSPRHVSHKLQPTPITSPRANDCRVQYRTRYLQDHWVTTSAQLRQESASRGEAHAPALSQILRDGRILDMCRIDSLPMRQCHSDLDQQHTQPVRRAESQLLLHYLVAFRPTAYTVDPVSLAWTLVHSVGPVRPRGKVPLDNRSTDHTSQAEPIVDSVAPAA